MHKGRVFANINLDGYKFNYVNSLTNAGRVGLFVKERIKFFVDKCIQRDLSIAETLWINVTLNDSSTVVGIVYRHPRRGPRDIEKFGECMQDIFDILNKKKRPFFIMGDFNRSTYSKFPKQKLFGNMPICCWALCVNA